MPEMLKFDVAKVKGGVSKSRMYRPLTHHVKTIGVEEFCRLLGERMGKGATLGRFATNATYDILVENLKKGYRIDLGWITLSPRIKGALSTIDAVPNSDAIEISASLSKDLRTCAQGIVPVNVNKNGSMVLYELQEDDCTQSNTLQTPGKRIVLNGSGLEMDLTHSDEGVWLEDKQGTLLERANVLQVDAGSCHFSFGSLPCAGKYVLVVSARNGKPVTYSSNRRTRQVVVKPT